MLRSLRAAEAWRSRGSPWSSWSRRAWRPWLPAPLVLEANKPWRRLGVKELEKSLKIIENHWKLSWNGVKIEFRHEKKPWKVTEKSRNFRSWSSCASVASHCLRRSTRLLWPPAARSWAPRSGWWRRWWPRAKSLPGAFFISLYGLFKCVSLRFSSFQFVLNLFISILHLLSLSFFEEVWDWRQACVADCAARVQHCSGATPRDSVLHLSRRIKKENQRTVRKENKIQKGTQNVSQKDSILYIVYIFYI